MSRRCLREPFPEIAEAAGLLDRAVTAHQLGQDELASDLLRRADMPEVRAWTESLWGTNSPYAPKRTDRRPFRTGVARMPGAAVRRQLHERDGYHCRFCGNPVIRKEVRQELRRLYPDVPLWGRRNVEQHAALQCMWAQYDHVFPYALGGTSNLENLVVTCAPCNYGRMDCTLEEAGLDNPFSRPPVLSSWDGLERLLKRASRHLSFRSRPTAH